MEDKRLVYNVGFFVGILNVGIATTLLRLIPWDVAGAAATMAVVMASSWIGGAVIERYA